jgi:hypothetical protein
MIPFGCLFLRRLFKILLDDVQARKLNLNRSAGSFGDRFVAAEIHRKAKQFGLAVGQPAMTLSNLLFMILFEVVQRFTIDLPRLPSSSSLTQG